METLRLHVATWNVACKPPENNLCLGELLDFHDAPNTLPDMYVIGLQEVNAQVQNMVLDAFFDDPWTRAFRAKLAEKDFVKIRTIRLQGLVLSIFVRRKLLMSVRDVAWNVVRTGLGGLWGNKGGVGLRLALGGVSVCFVNSHLTPHDHNKDARVNDYNAIVQQLKFPKHQPTEMVLFHDYVIWLGDHNFRLDESVSHEEVLSRIKADDLEWLRDYDQLKDVMDSGKAFSELVEPYVRFPPTFKFRMNTSDYDPKRRPAWTDRILYRVTENAYENVTLSIQPECYTSLPQYTQSDHKPVTCQFKIKTFADHVDRIVKFSLIKGWALDQENVITVTFGDDVVPHDFDWIGIYKSDYSSLDDYLSFLYINPRQSDDPPVSSSSQQWTRQDKKLIMTFPDHVLRGPGEFCLLYITEDWGSVLGVSNIFSAKFTAIGPNSSTNQLQDSFGSHLLFPSPRSSRKPSPARYGPGYLEENSSSGSDST